MEYLPKYTCYKVCLTSSKAIFQQELEPLSCTIAKSQRLKEMWLEQKNKKVINITCNMLRIGIG